MFARVLVLGVTELLAVAVSIISVSGVWHSHVLDLLISSSKYYLTLGICSLLQLRYREISSLAPTEHSHLLNYLAVSYRSPIRNLHHLRYSNGESLNHMLMMLLAPR